MAEVGDGISMRSEIGKDGEKEKNLYRYMPGGKSAEVSFPTWVYPAVDAENPVGEWNKLDLYVYGDKAIHVVNGVPAVSLTDLTYVDNQGNKNPLSKGRIQLQSEGVEVYFRDISIQPIEKLPEVVVAKTFVHIFSFKWIDKAQPADKALAAEQILAFKGQVPGLLHLWLGDNVSENSTEFSTTGVMIFDDKASFDAYTSHPAHLELLSWLVPLIEALEIDYEPM